VACAWLAVQIDPEFIIDAHTVDRCTRSAECRDFANVNGQDLGLDELLNNWSKQDGQLAKEGGTLVSNCIEPVRIIASIRLAKEDGSLKALGNLCGQFEPTHGLVRLVHWLSDIRPGGPEVEHSLDGDSIAVNYSAQRIVDSRRYTPIVLTGRLALWQSS
jgi:hypothetical protein